ncbi:MAG: putative phosphohydrolase [Candidatus Tokpelaia sp. JSC189]|nr:MAG: putative phosphohydrolase [Candidatus Tokpelaia sp. JSC189]
MFRFIHISDIHLAPLPQLSWRQLLGKRMTAYLNWKFNRKDEMQKSTFDVVAQDFLKQCADHIGISGDIVNLALDAEFSRARKQLLKLGDTLDISLVFGNHDVYVTNAFTRACQAFLPWIVGEKARKDSFFPYMRIRGLAAIIGASSAIVTPPFFAAGYLNKQQTQDLGFLLQRAEKQGLFRIVMIHHPPLFHAAGWSKRLWGIRNFQRIISAYGAELVLHGHTHLPTLSFIEGKQGWVPVVGVASASQDFGRHSSPAGYNLFEIGRKKHAKGWYCCLTRRALTDNKGHIATFVKELLHE